MLAKLSFDEFTCTLGTNLDCAKENFEDVNKICRAYQWSGEYYSQKVGNVKWKKVHSTKGEGGLGVRDTMVWNQAALGRYVWAIATKKDNLWIRWGHEVYVKEEEWWEYKPPQHCSWYWKIVCLAKDQMKMKFSFQQITNMTEYSIHDVYKKMIEVHPAVPWHGFVWSRINVPKHRFLWWLMMLDRLNTADRLNNVGVIDDPACLLCGNERETHNHLFFSCPFSKVVIRSCVRWLNLSCQDRSIQGLILMVNNSGGYKFRRQVKSVVICATAYQIWWARNDVLWNSKLAMLYKHV